MQAYEYRSMTDDQIYTELENAYDELFKLRFQAAIGQIKDYNLMKRLKRDIARMKTVLSERRIAAQEDMYHVEG